MTNEALVTQSALVETAVRLVADHPGIPAGSVLRCYSRAVRLARRGGAGIEELPERAEDLARRILAARARSGITGPVIPPQGTQNGPKLCAVPA
jgi:hypothetical protein